MHGKLQVCPKGRFCRVSSKHMVWLHGEWWEERNVLCLKERVAVLLQCIEVFFSFFLSFLRCCCLLRQQLLAKAGVSSCTDRYPSLQQYSGQSFCLAGACESAVLVLPAHRSHCLEREGKGSWFGELSSSLFWISPSPSSSIACPPSRLSERELVCPSDNLTLIQISCIRSRGRLYSPSELQPRPAKAQLQNLS